MSKLIILAVIVLLLSCDPSTTTQWDSEIVKQKNFTISTLEEAEIQALKTVLLTAGTRGKISWLIPQGARVKPGEVVAELEKENLEEELEHLTEDLKNAQEFLEELENSFIDEKKELAADLEKYETSLKIAQLQLQKLSSGPMELEKKEMQAELAQMKTSMENAEQKWQRSIKLVEKELSSKRSLQELLWQKKVSYLSYEIKKLEVEQALEGGDELEKKQAQLKVQLAQIDYDIAKQNWQLQVAKLQGDIELAKITVQSFLKMQHLLEKRLDLHTIKTPSTGVVLYRELTAGEKAAIGMQVWAGAGILEIPDLSQMKVVFQVQESLMQFIAVGKKIEVAIKNLPIYQGKIVKISSYSMDKNEKLIGVARREQGPSGIRVFDVEAQIMGKNVGFKMGMKAQVKIPLRTIENALIVSRKTVVRQNDKMHVMVKQKQKLVPKEVMIGVYNKKQVQIVEGLKVGEKIFFPKEETQN